MAIKVKSGGSYADVANVFVKQGGVYGAASVFAKVAGAYQAVGGGSSPSLPLDTLTAGAAYSVRRLRTDYTGPLLRVRRSSDNAEQDIGYGGDNWLDEAALTAFVGANNGFVTTWYDQSENARNMVQSNTARQPTIVSSGTVSKINTKPGLLYPSGGCMSTPSAFMYAAGGATSIIVSALPGTDGALYFSEASASSNLPYYFARHGFGGDPQSLRFFIRNDSGSTIVNNTVLQENVFDNILKNIVIRDTGSSLLSVINGNAGNSTNYTRSGSITLDSLTINGETSQGGQFGGPTGYFSEALFFPSALSNGDMNNVNASQGEAFGITVNPI